MGIYVFKKKALLELLNKKFPRANDFGSEIIPEAAKEMKVQAYLFNGYWEDIGTIRSFFDANLALAKDPARFEFYDADNPIYTSPRFLPPAKLMGCKVKDTILAHGVFMEGCDVESAIIGLRSRIGAGVTIRDSMIIGADYYESEEQRAHLLKMGKVPVGVGANSTIKNAIIDKNAGIGAGCKITNAAGVDEAARPEGAILAPRARPISLTHCGQRVSTFAAASWWCCATPASPRGQSSELQVWLTAERVRNRAGRPQRLVNEFVSPAKGLYWPELRPWGGVSLSTSST